MLELGATVLLPRPKSGRVVPATRRVRLADADPNGRCRLDSIARFLQDIATDDSDGAGMGDSMSWVVRRTLIEVRRAPRYQEALDLATWCSGHGACWAERRTELRGKDGADVDAVTIWVHVDPQTGKPLKLIDRFFEVWGEAADGRKVSARTSLETDPAGASAEPWAVRVADLDILGHMNNAAHWTPVEEALARSGMPEQFQAELEHAGGVEPHQNATLHTRIEGAELRTWLSVDGAPASVARVRALETA